MEKSSKTIVTALIAALVVVSGSFAAFAASVISAPSTIVETENESGDTVSVASSSTSFLYVQHAESGTIEPENDDSTDAIYKLTLNGINSNTMSFTDRPERKVDQITTTQYVGLWTTGQDSFEADPPNAALVINEADGSEEVFVVELLNPVYDAERQTFVYDIVELNPNERLFSFASSSASLPSSFGQASLFIDDAQYLEEISLLADHADYERCTPAANADLSNCSYDYTFYPPDFNVSHSALVNASFNGVFFSGADLSFANLSGADFVASSVVMSDFTNATLTDASFSSSYLAGADFNHANLTGAKFNKVNLSGANMTGVNFVDISCILCVFESADLSYTNFAGVDLSGFNIAESILTGAKLAGANLSSAFLIDSDLSGADLSGASLTGANLFGANLSGASLNGADLSGAELNNADLAGTDLTDVILTGADLTDATLTGAVLKGYDLEGVTLTGGRLGGANLSYAWLIEANLEGANLAGANFEGCVGDPVGTPKTGTLPDCS